MLVNLSSNARHIQVPSLWPNPNRTSYKAIVNIDIAGSAQSLDRASDVLTTGTWGQQVPTRAMRVRQVPLAAKIC